MKSYKVVITTDAKHDLKRYLNYIRERFQNEQAIRNVRNDFYQTASSLKTIAESLQAPDSEELRNRQLKRINFQSHEYFLLYRVIEGRAEIVRMFHSLEDFESKLS